MAKPSPRQTQFQHTHYFRKTVNWNDTGIAAGVFIGTLPAGAIITNSTVYVATAFNAGTTNVLTVGSAATLTEVVNNAASIPGTLGYKTSITPNASPYQGALAADTDLYVAYTQTGTVASAGQAVIVIAFIPNNDL